MSNGKGSARRPKQVSDAELDARWAATFGEWQPKTDLERAAEAAQREAARQGRPVYFEWQEYAREATPAGGEIVCSELVVREGDSYEVLTRRWPGA